MTRPALATVAEHRVPVVPVGARSGKSGGSLALQIEGSLAPPSRTPTTLLQ